MNSIGWGKTDSICIGTLLLFTLAFSSTISLFTRVKRHEALAAAAAYCTVLVVSLGNVGNDKNERIRPGLGNIGAKAKCQDSQKSLVELRNLSLLMTGH